MSDFPPFALIPPGRIISTGSLETQVGQGQVFCNMAIVGTSAWPTANLALFVPFTISSPITVVQMGVSNGGTVSGNLDVGIYDITGALLVSKGTTAQAGASAVQLLDITNTTLNPGTYFMAMAADNITGTYNSTTTGDQRLWQVCGMQQMATAFVLPATATFANPGQAYVPAIACLLDTVA